MPSGNAIAQEADDPPRFRIGALEIHPGFEVSVKADDNVFLTKTNSKNDTIMTYAPSIDVELPFAGDSSFEAGFDYTAEDFDKFGTEDNESKTTTIGLNLERINGNIYSRTNGIWEDTSDASSSEEETTTGPRTKRTKGEIDTELGFGGYDGSKLRLEANGGFTRNRYDDAAQDRLENDLTRVGGLVEIFFSPKTNIRIEYEFEQVEYTNRLVTDQRDDADDHAIRAGLSFTPSALITGHATFGAEFRKYDSNISATDSSDRDTNNFSADVDLTWQARPSKTTVNVTGSSSIENSSTPGQFGFRKWTIGGTLTQGLLFISQNLDLIVSSSLERNLFIRASRKDSLVNFSSQLRYDSPSQRFPWYASFEYEFERKTTNENKDSVEYDNNTFEFLVGMKY